MTRCCGVLLVMCPSGESGTGLASVGWPDQTSGRRWTPSVTGVRRRTGGCGAYIERRLQEGKTRREANRCLKRYLARNLYRLLEHGPPPTTW